jgi:battenin
MVGAYLLLLPPPQALELDTPSADYAAVPTDADADDDEEEEVEMPAAARVSYEEEEERARANSQPLNGHTNGGAIDDELSLKSHKVKIAFSEKLVLLRPMLFVFILPLVLVYFFEYTINQGVVSELIPGAQPPC